MDTKKEAEKYLNKYFKAQYLKETDDEYKALVKLLNKALRIHDAVKRMAEKEQKVEIKITDETGNVQLYVVNSSLHQIVWDGFLTAQYQDEQWHDKDTCDLIVKKLKGESPIEYAVSNERQ